MRTSYHEFACRVHVEHEAVVDHGGYFSGELGFDAGEQYGAYVLLDALLHQAVSLFLCCGGVGEDEFVVLCGYHYGVHALRGAVVRVFHCHLTL